jgi:magnesium transporter
MKKFAGYSSKKKGMLPGSPVYTGTKKSHSTKITVMEFNKKGFSERALKKAGECSAFKGKESVSWINVDGVHEQEKIAEIGACLGLHPLVIEDIADTNQRPKLEDSEECVCIILKMLYFDKEKKEVIAEQVSLVLGENFVVSFQEKEGDVFDHVRERIRENKGKIREMGADYLAYCLIDAIVDNYFVILEELGEEIEKLEEKLVKKPRPETLKVLHNLKREMIFLRKSVWPLREVIASLERDGSELVKKGTVIYLRDVYDHTIQVIETIETFRDMLSGMLDIYLSSMSNRMNEIMKVLTVIATIFIPLTFITGIYGMNFENMPELEWTYGYFGILAVMLVIGLVMVYYFKRSKWL